MDNRKIDRLIAEEIFGWDTHHYENINVISAFTEEEIINIPDDFCPSERIKDAWLVVEKFDYHKVEKDAGHYYVQLANQDTKFFPGDGETAPLAICLAALKSVGVEI